MKIRHLLLYALPAMPLSLMAITFYVYLPKLYTDFYGVNLTVLGVIILLSRSWDAILDPFIGWLSDKTTSSHGRRKPWILFSAIPLAGAFFLLTVPEYFPGSQPLYWITPLTFLFFLFWTSYSVPYEAWGTELSNNYDERNKIMGTREAGVILGTLLAAVIPYFLAPNLTVASKTTDAVSPPTLITPGIIYVTILLISTVLLVTILKEKSYRPSTEGSSIKDALRIIKHNRPFRILLISYTAGAFGAALPATLILYFVEYVIGDSSGSFYLVLYFGVGFLFLPLWLFIAKKVEKKPAWLLAMGVNSGAFFCVLFLGEGDTVLFSVLVALSAIGYGGALAIPASMQADVIDHEEVLSGERREGRIVGIWSICKKLAAALGSGLALPLLDLSGYTAGGPQPESAKLMLRVLYAGVPCLCNFVAIWLAFSYPIDRTFHTETLKKLEKSNE